MKKTVFLSLLFAISLSSCNSSDDNDIDEQNKFSKYVTHVFEFAPAPGQFTNKLPPFTEGDNAQSMLDKAGKLLIGTASNAVSLGAYGGYVVVGFDHSIVNKPDAKDFKVYGNAFENSAEPGIVMVAVDANGNGLPDDEWYELAGSEYERSTKNYSISYIRPNPINSGVAWFDNQGNSDTLHTVSSYSGASYFPLWIKGDTITFTGSLLPNNATETNGVWKMPPFGWGYADNFPNNTDGCKFDIDWAVDNQGNKVVLEKIDFIKIYTGVRQEVGWLGEISTEVSGVEDLNN